MDVKALRVWLMSRAPALVLVTADGATEKHRIEVANGTKWIQLARTICTLHPVLVETFDAKGNLLGALRPTELDDEEEEESDGAELVVSDPESQRLVIFARLLAEAYANSKAFTEMAFDKLGELFTAVSRRSESQEKTITALDRMVQKLVLEKVASGTGGDGEEPLTLNSLLQGFLQGKMQAEAEAAHGANGAPKGGDTK
jgi:hypothetical protein